jgi:hypothetical protein
MEKTNRQENEEMNPQEALKLIDNALAQLRVDRESHIKIQQAIALLRESIKEDAPKGEIANV